MISLIPQNTPYSMVDPKTQSPIIWCLEPEVMELGSNGDLGALLARGDTRCAEERLLSFNVAFLWALGL